MAPANSFAAALEAADRLGPEDQERLVEALRQRVLDRRRGELVRDVGQAQAEFDAGGAEARSPRELMAEILAPVEPAPSTEGRI